MVLGILCYYQTWVFAGLCRYVLKALIFLPILWLFLFFFLPFLKMISSPLVSRLRQPHQKVDLHRKWLNQDLDRRFPTYLMIPWMPLEASRVYRVSFNYILELMMLSSVLLNWIIENKYWNNLLTSYAAYLIFFCTGFKIMLNSANKNKCFTVLLFFKTIFWLALVGPWFRVY